MVRRQGQQALHLHSSHTDCAVLLAFANAGQAVKSKQRKKNFAAKPAGPCPRRADLINRIWPNQLHSKIDKRHLTISEAVTINGILHYRVNVEHGTTRSHKSMSSQALRQYRYRLTKTTDRPKEKTTDTISVAGDIIHTIR